MPPDCACGVILTVDKLCITFPVGVVQRPENKHWRGFWRGPFGYNEIPTSSCQTFCWKARHPFDVPFFCFSPALSAVTSRRDVSRG
jgi:hypothetical protein